MVGTGVEPDEIKALRDELAKAEQRAAVAEAQAGERARALDAAERNLADLRRMLPAPVLPPAPDSRRRWWRFWD
jgi:septal ring factor EnvC (AmiA/AmiB activator)